MKKLLLIVAMLISACSSITPFRDIDYSLQGQWSMLDKGNIHNPLATKRILEITDKELLLSIETGTVTARYTPVDGHIHLKTTNITDNLDFPKIVGEQTNIQFLHAMIEDEEFLAIRDIEDHLTLFSDKALSPRYRTNEFFYVFHRDGTRKHEPNFSCYQSFYGYFWHSSHKYIYIQEVSEIPIDDYLFTVEPRKEYAARYPNLIRYPIDRDVYYPVLMYVTLNTKGEITSMTPQNYIGKGIYSRPTHPLPAIQVNYALSEAHKAIKLLEPNITTVVFSATQKVTDFTILSLIPQVIDHTGKPIYKQTVLYTQDEILPGHSLTSDFNLTGDPIEINGISYKDITGKKHTMILNISGRDNSLVLVEIE